MLILMEANTDPPDAFTRDCSWCGDDPRPAAFCCQACEDASRTANTEPGGDDGHFAANHDADLAYLSDRGFR